MKLTKKKAVSIMSDVFGEDIAKLTERLFGREDVSEFLLAQELDEDIHDIRNKLYRLHNRHAVTWTKKKDPKKGWYVYYWTINRKRIKEIAEETRRERIEFLQSRLDREKGKIFYICCNKCVRFDFDKAIELGFRCPECSEILAEDDNTKTINHLENELARLTADA